MLMTALVFLVLVLIVCGIVYAINNYLVVAPREQTLVKLLGLIALAIIAVFMFSGHAVIVR